MEMTKSSYGSPVGELLLVTSGDRLLSLDYFDFEERFERLLAKRFPKTQPALGGLDPAIRTALDRYFAGDIAAVDQLAVGYHGTAFENRVWQALRGIAPGATASYGQLAAVVDSPKAARAVGRANSLNPIAIVVPCHRVIGANTKLTGYAGGLERKKWLLDHERKFCNPPVSI
jgi:methylated-DNA-[protein]-cysteine S-methyltransferase